MVNIIRTRLTSSGSGGSPRAEVGEIDTRAPFQSVRAAVSLFGEVSSSPKEKPAVIKRTKTPTEGVLDKEAQYHLAHKELMKFREIKQNAEAVRAEVLPELEKAHKTLDDLRQKLRAVTETKQTILEATEALKNKAKKLEEAKSTKPEDHNVNENPDIITTKEEYKTAVAELDAAKQELSNLHSDLDKAVEAKSKAIQQAAESDTARKVHAERVDDLSKQIATMKESLSQAKQATDNALQEQANIQAEAEARLQSHTIAREQVDKKIASLRDEYGPEPAKEVELRLAEMNTQIEVLEEQVQKAKADFLESERIAREELVIAKESLEQIGEEKKSLQGELQSLKMELESVGKELSEAKDKEAETASQAARFQTELEEKKRELETALANAAESATASDEMISAIQQLKLETEKAKQEAEEMKRSVNELQEEARTAEKKALKMENELELALKEAEDAKASDKVARDEIKAVSTRTDEARASTPNNKDRVKVSEDEYKSLNERANESHELADMKVAAAMAHIEASNASQKESTTKLNASQKELEELKVAIEEALKQAEMAEAAQRVIENELHKWRQQEQQVTPLLP